MRQSSTSWIRDDPRVNSRLVPEAAAAPQKNSDFGKMILVRQRLRQWPTSKALRREPLLGPLEKPAMRLRLFAVGLAGAKRDHLRPHARLGRVIY